MYNKKKAFELIFLFKGLTEFLVLIFLLNILRLGRHQTNSMEGILKLYLL